MFTLNQVFVLIGLFCAVTALIVGWITALLVIRAGEAEAQRRVDDVYLQVEYSIEEANAYYRNERDRRETAEAAHQEHLMQMLRAGELLGNEFSVESSADWNGTDRKVEKFNNVLEFLLCINECRAQGRTVNYTRVGSLILSN